LRVWICGRVGCTRQFSQEIPTRFILDPATIIAYSFLAPFDLGFAAVKRLEFGAAADQTAQPFSFVIMSAFLKILTIFPEIGRSAP